VKRIIAITILFFTMTGASLAQYSAAIGAAMSMMQAAAQAEAAQAAREAAAAQSSRYRNSPRVVYRDRRVAAPRTVYKTRTVYKPAKSHVASHTAEASVVRTSGKDPFASGGKGSEKFQ